MASGSQRANRSSMGIEPGTGIAVAMRRNGVSTGATFRGNKSYSLAMSRFIVAERPRRGLDSFRRSEHGPGLNVLDRIRAQNVNEFAARPPHRGISRAKDCDDWRSHSRRQVGDAGIVSDIEPCGGEPLREFVQIVMRTAPSSFSSGPVHHFTGPGRLQATS